MADLPSGQDPRNDLRAQRPPGAPAWVKVFGFIALILLLVILKLSGGNHGPGRHLKPNGNVPSVITRA